jgi:hypothetical protein
LQVWAEPFVTLRVPKLFNVRTDSFHVRLAEPNATALSLLW